MYLLVVDVWLWCLYDGLVVWQIRMCMLYTEMMYVGVGVWMYWFVCIYASRCMCVCIAMYCYELQCVYVCMCFLVWCCVMAAYVVGRLVYLSLLAPVSLSAGSKYRDCMYVCMYVADVDGCVLMW